MQYRSYWLMFTTESLSSRETADVRVHINNLNLTLKNHMFDGNDPFNIFYFLTLFVSEADMLNISEVQAFVPLPAVLAYFADS